MSLQPTVLMRTPACLAPLTPSARLIPASLTCPQSHVHDLVVRHGAQPLAVHVVAAAVARVHVVVHLKSNTARGRVRRRTSVEDDQQSLGHMMMCGRFPYCWTMLGVGTAHESP